MKEKIKILTPQEAAKKAVAMLKSKADPGKAAQAQKYFKEPVTFFGLTAAQVRDIGGELFEAVRKHWTIQEAIELCEILLPYKYYEARSVSVLIFLKYDKDFQPAHFSLIKTWLAKNYCDNWAMVDILCPDSLGVLLEKHPELIANIKDWTRSPNRWVQRASMVSFIRLARRGKFLDAVYKISERMFPVDDDLLHKANGWLLREAGKTDMPRLERFLLRHGRRIPRTTLRYAIERFPEGKRRQLLAKTK